MGLYKVTTGRSTLLTGPIPPSFLESTLAIPRWAALEADASQRWQAHVAPEAERLDHQIDEHQAAAEALAARHDRRQAASAGLASDALGLRGEAVAWRRVWTPVVTNCTDRGATRVSSALPDDSVLGRSGRHGKGPSSPPLPSQISNASRPTPSSMFSTPDLCEPVPNATRRLPFGVGDELLWSLRASHPRLS